MQTDLKIGGSDGEIVIDLYSSTLSLFFLFSNLSVTSKGSCGALSKDLFLTFRVFTI